MLKRINIIKNIGRFRNSSNGGVQFEKITLIHGRNTYGKSTLGDLFSSLASGKIDAIVKRRSIPLNIEEQSAILSFLGAGPREVALNLDSHGWMPSLPDGLTMHVFDDGFYHDNVFSSRKFNRDTKEKLSAFILGQQGVALATTIAEKNKDKGDAVRRKNMLKKDVFQNIKNLEQFLTMQVVESRQDINTKIDNIRSKIAELQNHKKKSSEISARKELLTISFKFDFKNIVESINQILTTSIDGSHEKAKQIVLAHINTKFNSPNGAEDWLAKGLLQTIGESCNFCGQSFDEKANDLLEAYRQYFDKTFLSNQQIVHSQLDQKVSALFVDPTPQLKLSIEKNTSTLNLYPELKEDEKSLTKFNDIIKSQNQLIILIERYNRNIIELKSHLEKLVESKKLAPHIASSAIVTDGFDAIINEIVDYVGKYNTECNSFNLAISMFKKSINSSLVLKNISDFKIQEEVEVLKIKRVDLSSQCSEYIDLSLKITKFDQEMPELQNSLIFQQDQFLTDYFLKLNEYFRAFGSQDFTLEKALDTSGHKPVYYLKVKFLGVDIPEKDLDRVYSESDRRALALAIFAASIDAIPSAKKRNAIIVMDDPVTSFDNHRMSSIHRYIVNLSEEVRQVIVLSHFEDDLSRFLHCYRKCKPVKLLEISNQNGSSVILQPDIDEFLLDDHQKKRKNIFNFVGSKITSHASGDLRIFLEMELGYRFAKQISDNKINADTFSELIDHLFNKLVISDALKAELHAWREDLNPDHHRWTGSDLEDQRNSARRFIEFLYKKVVPLN